MKVVPITKTQSAQVEVTPKGLLDLQFFLSGLLIANKQFTETVSWWLTKNENKLKNEIQKCMKEDKATDEKYVSKGKNGMFRLWDQVEGGFTCLLKEMPDGKTIFVDENEKEIPAMEKDMYLYVEDPELRKEWLAEKERFSTQAIPMHVVQIKHSLLENINIPTMGSSQEGGMPRKLNRELFYDTLVMPDPNEPISEEEFEEEEEPKEA